MTAALPPYPAYKDSGVPWLGRIPAHWMLMRGKWLFRSVKEINSDHRYTNVLSLTLRGVVNNDLENPEGLVPKDYATYQFFAQGDLVFKLIDLENLRTSRVGLVHEDGIMSSAYVRLIPTHKGVRRFYFHQYFDLYQRGVFNQLGAGVRSTLGQKDLLEIPIVVPDLDEQHAITRYLDHVDRRIRRYIRAMQRLIALLEEQKQAIIHQAVTRGLDPNVRLKPSGVAWLGDVPEHWEVMRLKALVTESVAGPYGSSLTKAMYTSNGYRVYGQQQVIPDNFSIGDYYIPRDKYEEMKRYRVFPGDVLVSVMGTVGKVAVVPEDAEPGIINPRLVRYRPNTEKIRPRYLQLAMRGPARMQANEGAKGTTMEGLNLQILGRLWLAIPPLFEQDAILAAVDVSTEQLSQGVDVTRRNMGLLREYRTRLIADVVTGQVDVRAAAAQLPEEAEEMDALEEVDELTEDEEGDEQLDVEEETDG